MTIRIRGIGWVTKTGYGTVRTGEHTPFAAEEGAHSLGKLGLFTEPFRNFRRLDEVSRLMAGAVALALRDAGIEYSARNKQDTGIIATSGAGSLQSDLDYYADFVKNGRTLSLANLFIYTLPSSPLGEAAIHFGLTGPLLFTSALDARLEPALRQAGELVVDGEASRMLAGGVVAGEAICFVMDGEGEEDALCRLDEILPLVNSPHDIPDVLRQLTFLMDRKA